MNILQFAEWRQNLDGQNWQKPLIMGILNVTPDSFSDGGKYNQLDSAMTKAQAMITAGASIIDIGGESTRPFAEKVSIQDELDRVIPVIKMIRSHSDVLISVDTSKAQVMEKAIEAGASMINDIHSLKEKNALKVALESNVPVCLMHMLGQPKTMQNNPFYSKPVIEEIESFFCTQIARCLDAGIERNQLIIDPGFGFGKTVQHNLQLVKDIAQLKKFKLPVLIGVSRKSTIGSLLNKNIDERLIGGIAFALYAVMQGVNIIRTHDVSETKDALEILHAIQTCNTGETWNEST